MIKTISKQIFWFVRIVSLALAVLVGIFLARMIAGRLSASETLRSLEGAELVATPETIDLGKVDASDVRVAKFAIKNVTNRPIRLLDCITSCSCTVSDTKFPLLVGPKQTKWIPFKIDFHGKNPGVVFEEVALLPTTEDRRALRVRITADVQASAGVAAIHRAATDDVP